ncbi:MAG: response regulator transcription factor [Gammaproteobacteria bacterium]|nr:response regulator transcription factor [Gammaproteobacteria bacterium]
MRLLLVEDDPMIGESVRRGLRRDGFTVDWVNDAESAEPALNSGNYDLLLLDLALPRKSGLDLLRELRSGASRIPVLVLTARDAVADRVRGLDTGADDYLVKPFDLDELGARVRALLRRQSGRIEPEISHGDLRLNPATHEAVFRGRDLTLSAREFALLAALLEKPGAVLSRSRLEERLYGWGEEVESNTVEVHVHNLRKKLGTPFIRTVRGVGYMVPRRP